MRIPTIDTPPQDGVNFKMVPDSEKDKAYVLRKALQYYSIWSGYPLSTASGAATINCSPWWAQRNRDFSRGLDTGDEQRTAYQLNDSKANDAQTAMLIPWDPSMFQVKPMNIIRHFLEKRATNISAYPADPSSTNKRMKDRFAKMAKAKMAKDPVVAQLDAAMGVQQPVPLTEPQSETEVDLYSKMAPKDVASAMLTNAISLLHNINGYSATARKRLAWELIDTGIAIAAVRPMYNGFPEVVSIPVEDAILPYNRDGIFDDPPFGGWLDWRTPMQVLAEMGEEGRPGDLKQLNNLVGRPDGRLVPTNIAMGNYKPGCVPVLRIYFKDVNHLEVSSRKGRDGGEIYRQGEPRNKKWKSSKKPYEVVYQANWVVGSSQLPEDIDRNDEKLGRCLAWKCQLMDSQPRNGVTKDGVNPVSPDGGYKAQIPMVIRGHNMTNMAALSIAELARVKMMEINNMVIQLRHAIQSIIPPGLGEVHVDAIMAAMADLNMPPEEKVPYALKMFRQIGAIPVKRGMVETPDGLSLDSRVMAPHGGFMGNLGEMVNAIEAFKSWLYEVLGVNDATMGNTTDSKMLVGTLKIQAQGTAAALGTLFDCFDCLERDIALLEYKTLRCGLKNGLILEGPVEETFGQPATKWLRFTEEDDPGCIGIIVEQKITDEEKLKLHEACMEYMQLGLLTPGDKLAVERIENYTLAVTLLDTRVQKNKEDAHKKQLEIQQATAQGAMQSAQVVSEAKSKDAELKAASEAQNVQVKSAAQMEVERLKAENQQTLMAIKENSAAMLEMNRQNHEMNMLMQKLLAESEMAREDRMSKEKIAEDTAESREEVAEKQMESKEAAAEESED